MNREDLIRMIGPVQGQTTEYVPVACLLSSGYACVGYYNSLLNEGLIDTVVLLNTRLVDLRHDDGQSRRGRVADFNDFLEDIVTKHYAARESDAGDEAAQEEGTIPLTAIPLNEISLLYPVAHIAKLLKRLRKVAHEESRHPGNSHEDDSIPTFFDFNNKSIVLKALRTKLW